MKKFEVIEDNGGGLTLVVFATDGTAEYIHHGYEYNLGQLTEDLRAIRDGADPANDWDRDVDDPQGWYDDLLSFHQGRDWEVVADNDGIYPGNMGCVAEIWRRRIGENSMEQPIIKFSERQLEILRQIRDNHNLDITIENDEGFVVKVSALTVSEEEETRYTIFPASSTIYDMDDGFMEHCLENLFLYILRCYFEDENEEDGEEEPQEDELTELTLSIRRVRNMHDISQIQSEYNKAELECVAELIARSDRFQKKFNDAFNDYLDLKNSSKTEEAEAAKDRIIQIINYVIEYDQKKQEREEDEILDVIKSSD